MNGIYIAMQYMHSARANLDEDLNSESPETIIDPILLLTGPIAMKYKNYFSNI